MVNLSRCQHAFKNTKNTHLSKLKKQTYTKKAVHHRSHRWCTALSSFHHYTACAPRGVVLRSVKGLIVTHPHVILLPLRQSGDRLRHIGVAGDRHRLGRTEAAWQGILDLIAIRLLILQPLHRHPACGRTCHGADRWTMKAVLLHNRRRHADNRFSILPIFKNLS